MINNRTRAMESFVVAAAAQATVPSSGTLNNSNGNVNLANGQLGIVSVSPFGTTAMNAFTDATPTLAEAPAIAIYQGTSSSAGVAAAQGSAVYPLAARPYEKSWDIDGRRPIQVTKQSYRAPSHSVWVLGNTPGSTGAINVPASTETSKEYALTIAFRGRRVSESHSAEQAAALQVSVTTPNFTTLSYDANEATDWITTKLAWEINLNSQILSLSPTRQGKYPVLALLIDTTGVTGTAIGGVSPIAEGTSLTVANTALGVRNVVLTDALATSIKNAALSAAGGVIADLDWSVVPIDLSEAGEVTTSIGEVIMIIGLDDRTAYVDFIPEVKNRLNIGLTAGFDADTVNYVERSFANEGEGTARALDLWYKATQGQRKYFNRHDLDPVIDYPSPVDLTQKYVIYNIVHSEFHVVDTSSTTTTYLKSIVLIPQYSTGTTVNPLIATFDGIINSYLGSTVNNSAIVTI